MRSGILIATSLFSFVTLVLCDCNDPTAQKDIKLDQTEGVWYGLYTLKESQVPKDSKCLKIQHTVKADGKSIELIKSTLSLKGVTPVRVSFQAKGRLTEIPGKIIMTGNTKGKPFNFDYWILGTDYSNYMIVHACAKGLEKVWTILSRDRILSDPAVLTSIKDTLSKNHLAFENFQISQQGGCTTL